MVGRLLVLAAALSLACTAGARADEQPPPPEVVLSTPPVETLAKAPTPWMRTQLTSLQRSLRPARRAHPRVLARLKLELPRGSGHIWFVTYRSRSGRLCGVTFESQPGSSSWATGGLPCTGSCQEICAGAGMVDHTDHWTAWSGTVPSMANGARFTFSDGSRFRFSLVGPRIRGALDRRVLLVQLPVDRDDFALVEALQGDAVIASQSYAP
jgi:hypothetical protein